MGETIMLVSESLSGISLEEFLENAEGSDYLMTEYEFLEKVWSREVESLTEKQQAWIEKIAKRVTPQF